jgi:hypothetical protein
MSTRSWRALGFIPGLEQKSRATKAAARNKIAKKGLSTRNYHQCLSAILLSFVEAQTNKISHHLPLGNKSEIGKSSCSPCICHGPSQKRRQALWKIWRLQH